jgi:predicted TIM-barrel fold metal-dependent hydrolase
VIVDGHCHVWPDAVAERALAVPSGELRRFGDGKVSSLLAAMDEGGVDFAVCLAVANTADRVEAANRFVGSLDPRRLVGFGSIHVGLSPGANVESLRRYGLRGVKVHPLFQGYSLDDSRLFEIFEALEGEFVVTVHVGEGGEGAERCSPAMVRTIARTFPKLDLIACHFGGYKRLDEAEELVVGLPNISLDTSWPPSLASIDTSRLRRLIGRHGHERIVFASDWPMADPAAEARAVRNLGLSEEQTAAILGGNLARLLDLPISSAEVEPSTSGGA